MSDTIAPGSFALDRTMEGQEENPPCESPDLPVSAALKEKVDAVVENNASLKEKLKEEVRVVILSGLWIS